MQALVFKGPWELAVEEVADPATGREEVQIRITATGICGSDIHGYTGENGRRHPGQVMGHETVGRIIQVGDGVDLQIGALVTVNPVIACGACDACSAGAEQSCPTRTVVGVEPDFSSAFAELLVVPARNVVPVPESMPEEYGALIEPLAVGYHAAVRGGCGPQDRVLVIGGGPIGQAAALAARRLGVAQIVVSEPTPSRRKVVESLGFTALDPTSEDVGTGVATALGGAATLVLDAVGTSQTLADALTASTLGARIVLVGMGAPSVELSAYAISTEERSLVGSFCYSAEHFRSTAEWVGTGPAELAHLVDGRTDMIGAVTAFAELGRGERQSSKVLVYPGGVPQRLASVVQ